MCMACLERLGERVGASEAVWNQRQLLKQADRDRSELMEKHEMYVAGLERLGRRIDALESGL